jgi:lactobin A/cerein 7B family class IIb bacteriocin
MDIQKIEQLMKDEAFVAELAAMKSVEEITVAVNAKGVCITVEEMETSLDHFLAQQNDELTEDNLDTVSGGIGPGAIIVGGLLIWSAVSIICGALDGLKSCGEKSSKKKKKKG